MSRDASVRGQDGSRASASPVVASSVRIAKVSMPGELRARCPFS